MPDDFEVFESLDNSSRSILDTISQEDASKSGHEVTTSIDPHIFSLIFHPEAKHVDHIKRKGDDRLSETAVEVLLENGDVVL